MHRKSHFSVHEMRVIHRKVAFSVHDFYGASFHQQIFYIAPRQAATLALHGIKAVSGLLRF